MNNLTTKDLKAGKEVRLSNEAHQISIGGDDVREAKVRFSKTSHSWGDGFQLWFNGQLIHSCKTLCSLKKQLRKLIQTWSLEVIEE